MRKRIGMRDEEATKRSGVSPALREVVVG